MAMAQGAYRAHMMEHVRDQTARFRKTFRYPADEETESIDSQPDAIDEEEQEQLINRLIAENTSGNAFFTRILFILPLAALLPYIPSLFNPTTAVLSLLSMTSLAATIFLLWRLPHAETGIAPLDNLHKKGDKTTARQMGGLYLSKSPLDTYLPYLNLALVGLLVLMGMVTRSEHASFAWIGMGNLPGVVYGVVIIAKLVMAGVDPESELSKLKYEFKGA